MHLPAPRRKNKTISAKTRSWEKAESQAQEIRDSWDPVKHKLWELGELVQAKELVEVTTTDALDGWLTTVRSESDFDTASDDLRANQEESDAN